MEVSETPTTPTTPATESGTASKSESRQIRVIQFCHLKKHCSKETCLDYMDFKSMMKPENQGKEIYTTDREGVLGRDPPMVSSIWRDWKSEKGRWFVGLYSNDSDEISNRKTSKAIHRR